MSRRMPTHIQFGVIQRSKGQSARARQAYQMCSASFDATGRKLDFRAYKTQHLATAILLPPRASPTLLETDAFIDAIEASETRVNSQECRTLDFDLPRGLELAQMLPVAAFVIAPLVATGMAAQIDVECPLGSDGGDHPHAHVMLAMRELTGDRFGKKVRAWNDEFQQLNGRQMRALIAGRLTLAAAYCGLNVVADPRTADAAGAPTPILRLPRAAFRQHSHSDQPLLHAMRNDREATARLKSEHTGAASSITTVEHNAHEIMIWPITSSPCSDISEGAAGVSWLYAVWRDGLLEVQGVTTQVRRFRCIANAIKSLARLIADLGSQYVVVSGDTIIQQTLGQKLAELDNPVALVSAAGGRFWSMDPKSAYMDILYRPLTCLTGFDHLIEQIALIDTLFGRPDGTIHVTTLNDEPPVRAVPERRKKYPVVIEPAPMPLQKPERTSVRPSIQEHLERIEGLSAERYAKTTSQRAPSVLSKQSMDIEARPVPGFSDGENE